MTKFLFWKRPLLSGSDTAAQATALAAHLHVKATSQTHTDVHPLISLSKVFQRQSQINIPEAGRKITFKMKVQWKGSDKKGVAGRAMSTLQWQWG